MRRLEAHIIGWLRCLAWAQPNQFPACRRYACQSTEKPCRNGLRRGFSQDIPQVEAGVTTYGASFRWGRYRLARPTTALPTASESPVVGGGGTRQAEPLSGPVTVAAMNGPCHGRNDGDVTAPPMALRRPRATCTRCDAAPTFPRGGVPHSPPRFAGAVFFLGLLYQRPIPLRQPTGLTMPPRLGDN